jgi:hypothetical protein
MDDLAFFLALVHLAASTVVIDKEAVEQIELHYLILVFCELLAASENVVDQSIVPGDSGERIQQRDKCGRCQSVLHHVPPQLFDSCYDFWLSHFVTSFLFKYFYTPNQETYVPGVSEFRAPGDLGQNTLRAVIRIPVKGICRLHIFLLVLAQRLPQDMDVMYF